MQQKVQAPQLTIDHIEILKALAQGCYLAPTTTRRYRLKSRSGLHMRFVTANMVGELDKYIRPVEYMLKINSAGREFLERLRSAETA